ncbi:ABC transporter ATP-binding protein [Actinokineospora soli]|uniref:ABC transporter ATP-binding protein n=1 Tax=Actinokineospora soli TaxID=1048753 RepID=A0ABW2TTQ6_9PSEU
MTGLWRSVLLPHRGRIALALSAAAVSAGIGLLTPYLVKVAIDDGIVAGDLDVLDTVALVYLLAVAVRFTANRVHGVVLASTAHAVLADLRVRVFGHLQGVALGDEGGGDPGTGVGQRLARVVNDVNSLGKALTESASTLVVSGVTLLGAATTLAVLDWRLAAATLVVVPVLVLLGARHQKASGPAWRGLRAAESTTTATTREVFATARTAQAFGREDEAAALVRSALDAENRAERRTVRLSATFFPAVELAGALVTAVVLGLGGGLVLAGDLEVGVLVAFTLYQRALFGPVMGVSDVFDTLQAARAGAERLRETLATAETTPAPADPVPLTPGPHPVRMRAVGFGYTPDRPVLRGVDLTVPAGTSVALVGPTGAGKSTIAKLALRLHDPDHGSVHIGSMDLRQVDPRSLRRTIGYVPQDFPCSPERSRTTSPTA